MEQNSITSNNNGGTSNVNNDQIVNNASNSNSVPENHSVLLNLPNIRVNLLRSVSSGSVFATPNNTSASNNMSNLRHSWTNVIREIEPFVQTARHINMQEAISMLNNHPHAGTATLNPDQTTTNTANNTNNDNRDVIVDVENDNIGNNNNNDAALEGLSQNLQNILKYFPFVLILLVKATYDFHQVIFIFMIMFFTCLHSNSIVVREATKADKRSISTLVLQLLYIACCIFIVLYLFEDVNNVKRILSLITLRTFPTVDSVWSLIWIILIGDFILKMITICAKLLLTMMPQCIVQFPTRGRFYLLIEAISQFYRGLVTIQPWLLYLLECYQGIEKILAVFFSAFYMICKGSDMMLKLNLVRTAVLKVLHNVSIGSVPSKDQIESAGDQCPICHDTYSTPVLLSCKHIFCENCVSIWLDREPTCPLCRAKIMDDSSWRDGSTSNFLQIF